MSNFSPPVGLRGATGPPCGGPHLASGSWCAACTLRAGLLIITLLASTTTSTRWFVFSTFSFSCTVFPFSVFFLTCFFCLNHTKAHPIPARVDLACWRPASTTLAQHSAISHARSSKARTCRSQCDNASKQTELARVSMPSSICSSLCSQIREEIEICRGKTNLRPQAVGDDV